MRWTGSTSPWSPAAPGPTCRSAPASPLDDEHLLLVGSHGAELPLDGHDDGLDDAERERLSAVQARLETLAAEHPGAFVEHKPTAAVLHTRRLPPDEAAGGRRRRRWR